jgi:hypothetical protein
LATPSIGVIVLNQIVGPPMLKWAFNRVGEAHTRAETPEFDGIRDAVIFGVEGQSLALARQLEGHDWNVLLVTRQEQVFANGNNGSRPIHYLPDISEASLRSIDMEKADSVVLMLSAE